MDIKEKLLDLVRYYEVSRQAGHTNTLINGIKNTSCIVLLNNLNMERFIKDKVKDTDTTIKFESLHSYNHIGIGCKLPLAIDNAALYTLFLESYNEIQRLEKENDDAQKKLKEIKQTLNG